MKKITQFISTHKKKLIVLLTIAIVFAMSFAAYVLISMNKNIKLMDEDATKMVNYYPEYPVVNTTGANAEQIKRGEYLSKAGDCIACHTNTPVKGQTFAGGLAMHTPFGTIYSPNITPDKTTGIGGWTDEQFIKAMRQGISPQGHFYFPAFPYYYFNKLSDDDLKAIKAYLANLPAIKQANRDNEMILPFNFRIFQFGWRLLFFYGNDTGPYQLNPKQSAEWNRGAYLVDGLGHCAMCHSPSYHLLSESVPLGAPIKKYYLSGAKILGYLAPNISKSNLGNVPNEEVVQVFTQDKLIGGGHVEGPMLEVNHDSLRYMSNEDLTAMTTYLKTVESQSPPVAKSGTPGKGVYEGYCSGCHTTGAGGAPKYGDATAWDSVIKTGMDTVYKNAIQGINGMPAKGTCISCTDNDVKQAVDYMVGAVSGVKGKPQATAVKAKPLTLADGQRIYDTNCAVCHNVGFKKAPKPGDHAAWQPIYKNGFLKTYLNVVEGRNGHPARGACTDCSDAELKAAVKWMMQQGTTTENYSLW